MTRISMVPSVLLLVASAGAAMAQPCGQVAWTTIAQLDGQRDAAGAADPFFAVPGTAVMLATSGVQANTTWRLQPGPAAGGTLGPGVGWGWSKLAGGGVASGRARSGMAPAPWRGRIVLFGGRDLTNTSFNQIWELGTSAWTRVSDPAPPLPVVRDWPAVATIGDRLLVFGGLSGSSRLNDTWSWDGATWVRLFTGGEPNMPVPRFGAAIAFDPTANAAVMFGGNGSGTSVLGDTWEFHNNSWTQVIGGVSPPAMGQSRMAFDGSLKRAGQPGQGGVVLFGGVPASGGPSSRTWTRVNGAWEESPVGGPTARSSHTMASVGAASQDAVALFGGVNGAGSLLADTWIWRDGAWSLIAEPPSPREGVSMATDPKTGRVIMFGGNESASVAATITTYEWSGAAWRPLSISGTQPGGRAKAVFASMPGFGAVLAGGASAAGAGTAETWVYDGESWRSLEAMPFTLFAHAGACFEPTGELIIHGGVRGAAQSAATLTFDGESWRQLSISRPGARAGHSMAFDPVRERVVLFGGSDGASLLGDTWTYDGTQWRVAATSGPAARSGHTMAYDAARGVVVLYGGLNAAGNRLGDVWEWNGSSWVQPIISNPAGAPTARSNAAAAFDPAGERVLVFGGLTLASSNDTFTIGGRQTPTILSATSGQMSACYRQSFSLGAHALGGGLSYQWRRDSAPLSDSTTPWGTVISGSRSPTLSLGRLAAEDAGSFDCVITNTCGQTTTMPTVVHVCEADTDCDGFISADDFEAYVAGFDGNTPVNPDFDGDGFVDGFDYDAFVAAFERGCG